MQINMFCAGLKKKWYIISIRVVNNKVLQKTLEEDEIRKKASGSFQFGPGYKIAPVENSKKFQFKITGSYF